MLLKVFIFSYSEIEDKYYIADCCQILAILQELAFPISLPSQENNVFGYHITLFLFWFIIPCSKVSRISWTLSIILSFISNATFQRLDPVTALRWNLLIWAQYVELVSVSGHQ
jgi:hypothetical protein